MGSGLESLESLDSCVNSRSVGRYNGHRRDTQDSMGTVATIALGRHRAFKIQDSVRYSSICGKADSDRCRIQHLYLVAGSG